MEVAQAALLHCRGGVSMEDQHFQEKKSYLCVKGLLEDLGFQVTLTGNIKEHRARTHYDCLPRREESDNFGPKKEADQ